MRVLLIVCLMIAAFTVIAHADDNPTTPWTVETRCIPEPTEPPDGWTYPGTLLMTGYAGIHALQADWETPHILAFLSRDSDGNEPLMGGQLSPDGNWYAVPMGEEYMEVSYNMYYFANGVRVYSLRGDGEIIDFDLSDYSEIYPYSGAALTYLVVTWLNVDSFIVGGLRFYPFERRAELAQFHSSNVGGSNFIASPDLTRIYGYFGYRPEADNVEFIPLRLSDGDGAAWRRDSAGFVAPIGNNQDGDKFIFYNRDGERPEFIFDLGTGSVDFDPTTPSILGLAWSPDDDYLAFVHVKSFDSSSLYLVDWAAQLVIDTCLAAYSNAVWSPDGSMVAYFAPTSDGNLSVNLIDFATWQAYRVGMHSGRLLGWRGD